jgi:hypothetical protein
MDLAIDSHNPKCMDPTGAGGANPDNTVLEGWLDNDRDSIEWVTLSDSCMATLPVPSHIHTDLEMEAYSTKNRESDPTSDCYKSSKEIIQAAIVFSCYLESWANFHGNKSPIWFHKPDKPYTNQDLVILCYLVDCGHKCLVDTQFNKGGEIALHVMSYRGIMPDLKLGHYL